VAVTVFIVIIVVVNFQSPKLETVVDMEMQNASL
jgi:hypothetical protein